MPINPLRESQRRTIKETFFAYPEICFTPQTMALTAKVNPSTTKATMILFTAEGYCIKVAHGVYKKK